METTSLHPPSPVLQLRKIMADLLFPPLVLLLGAGLALAIANVPGLVARRLLRWDIVDLSRFGLTTIITVALLLTLIKGNATGALFPIRSWSSLSILAPPLTWQSNEFGRLLSLALIAIMLAAVLLTKRDQNNEAENGEHGDETDHSALATRARDGALLLTVLAAGLATLLPANLLTLALAWAVMDIVAGVAWLYTQPGNDDEWHSVLLSWSAGLAGTIALWGAALPQQANSAGQNFSSLTLSGWTGIALVLAILFRLSPYPFHLLSSRTKTTGAATRAGLMIALQAAPAAAGIYLMTQLAGWEALPGLWRQLASALLITGLVGCGVLAWLSRQGSQTVGWILTGQAGLVVLAGLWAGPEAALAEGMVLILVGGLLTLYTNQKTLSVENRVSCGIGIAALAGLPLTWGGDSRLLLFASWLDDGWGLEIFLVAGAYLLILAAAGRLLFRPADHPSQQRERVVVGLALSLPALGLLIRNGTLAMRGGVAWLAILLPLAGGAPLAWRAESFQAIQERVAPRLQLLALDWLVRPLGRISRLAARVIQAIHQVLEGEGAFLWALIWLALGWLLLSTRPPV